MVVDGRNQVAASRPAGKTVLRGATLIGLLLAAALTPGPAGAQRAVLDDYPAMKPDALPEKQRSWLEREVMWIITEAERDVFLRLTSAPERDRFIELFWHNRDPTPGTPRNEYREVYYQRLAKADKEFGRETSRPGRLTDRGHFYILLGEPRTVERYPGSPVMVPVEVWWYSVDPILGIPPFFNLLFFRQRGFGEHRLYSPIGDGPESLLNPAGQNEATSNSDESISPSGTRPTGFSDLGGVLQVLRTVDRKLADISLSLIPGDAASFGMSPLRSEALLAQLFEVPARLMPDPSWAYRVLVGAVETEVRFDTLPMELEAVALMDPSGVPYLHYAARLPGNVINIGNFEGGYYATYEVTAGVRDKDLRFVVAPEPQTIQLELDASAARRIRSANFVQLGRIPLVDGQFDLDLTLENNVTHRFGRVELPVWAPSVHPAQVTSSRPILVTGDDHLGKNYDPFGKQYPFQIGSHFMMPAFNGPFVTGGTLWVFHQLYAPAEAAGPVTASYEVRDAGGGLVAEKSSPLDLGNKDRFGVLSQLAAIALTGLGPGEYVVRVDFDADDQAPRELPFSIVDPETYVEPVPQATGRPPATDSGERLVRARQLHTLGRAAEAIDVLSDLLTRSRSHKEALALQIELLSDAGRVEELAELLRPRLVDDPKDTDLLVLLAQTEARLGSHRDAIRYYERARLAGVPETPELLNGLAAAYVAGQQPAKALKLLDLSLQLDPQQGATRELKKRLGSDPQSHR